MTFADFWMVPGLRALAGAGIGLIIGSFLGALVMRWPAGKSILRGRSRCDTCNGTLGVRDLIPVLSALLLGLRCRVCGARIDPVHVGMEAGCAVVGAAAFAFAIGPFAATGWCLLGWILLALAVLDFRHFWLPNALTLPLAGLGFILGPFTTAVTLTDRWIGAGTGYVGLLLIAVGYRVIRRREGLGLGDAKLVGAIGAWAGWQALPFVLLGASLLGIVWISLMMARGGDVRRDTPLPLGTLLCLAFGPALYVAGAGF